jgi:hypothetical protein
MTKINITDDVPNGTSPPESKPDDGVPLRRKFNLSGRKPTMTMSPQSFRRKYSTAGRLGVKGNNYSINAPSLPSRTNMTSQSQFAPSLQEFNLGIDTKYSKDSRHIPHMSIYEQSISGNSSEDGSSPRLRFEEVKKTTSHQV